MTHAPTRGRRKRNRSAAPAILRRPNYRQLKHPFPQQTMFSDDEIHAIHDTALRVIEELGIKVLLPEARDIFAKAGARVDDDHMVYLGRDVVEAALKTAPRSIRLRARNPLREQDYELGSMIFMPGVGCPNANDAERGRRPGSLADFTEAIKLCQHYDVMHTFGPLTEAQDVPIHLRHYETMRVQLEYGDKPMFLYARGRGQVQQGFEMAQTALNLTTEEFETGTWITTVINSNSPRMLDNPMAQGIIDFARANQISIITPFCLAGAMAPITPAGALTLQHAEALFGITLAQLARAGAPVSYGGFSSNVHMKSGAPAFGTPDHLKMQIGGGQLAKLIDLPWRTASGSASNTADMQSSLETVMGLWGGSMAHGTLLVHTAGWLEGGLTFGYEKFINDIESLQIFAELCERPKADDAEIGFDALADVQPGGHFFATQHTMDRYQTAFYEPIVADLNNFGSWTEAGSRTSTERAVDVWKGILRDFTPPEGGAEAVERMRSYVEKATAAGGAPPLD
ncbi:trimethylamine methyltransferase family protein [Amylibacter sp. IMCC11727]|uniref:trimethylamine methyltransferase family protein n=1 Tax=Amylibacter sp. IMCC11727 TaxID=3039851 RepID=UPI00244E0E4A|nr:trimethylamine methyltransferase family protein [Amylibacter sp. IMCC11727]WGI21252.1 trimethylamine methyltransferase family protein [Amylibacter sp. IMCC11727]